MLRAASYRRSATGDTLIAVSTRAVDAIAISIESVCPALEGGGDQEGYDDGPGNIAEFAGQGGTKRVLEEMVVDDQCEERKDCERVQ